MLSISASVSASYVSRKPRFNKTLLVRTRVCNPDNVLMVECGYLPGVNVLVDGLSAGKVAMITSDHQGILLAGI
jgi:hypothetical protein